MLLFKSNYIHGLKVSLQIVGIYILIKPGLDVIQIYYFYTFNVYHVLSMMIE